MSLISVSKSFSKKSGIMVYSAVNTIDHTAVFPGYYINNNSVPPLFSPLPEDENPKHISYATPESDFTGPRMEELLQIFEKNNIYKIDSKRY